MFNHVPLTACHTMMFPIMNTVDRTTDNPQFWEVNVVFPTDEKMKIQES